MTIDMSPFPRCQEAQPFGPAPGRLIQCRLPDPHPDADHDFGIDWPEYGRDLDQAPQAWLAGTLRDLTARARYLERRETELTAHAVRLALVASGSTLPYDLADDTKAWLRKNAPATATALLGLP